MLSSIVLMNGFITLRTAIHCFRVGSYHYSVTSVQNIGELLKSIFLDPFHEYFWIVGTKVLRSYLAEKSIGVDDDKGPSMLEPHDRVTVVGYSMVEQCRKVQFVFGIVHHGFHLLIGYVGQVSVG